MLSLLHLISPKRCLSTLQKKKIENKKDKALKLKEWAFFRNRYLQFFATNLEWF